MMATTSDSITASPEVSNRECIDTDELERRIERQHRWRYPRWPHQYRRRKSSVDVVPESVAIRIAESPDRVDLDIFRVGKNWGGWLLSLSIHLAVIAALAIYSLRVENDPEFIYLDVLPRSADEPELQVLEVVIPHPVVEPAGPEHPAFDVDVSLDLNPGGAMPRSVRPTDSQMAPGPVSDVTAVLKENGTSDSLEGDQAGGAEFFGIASTGSRFVFVVDASTSMLEDDKWQTARRELISALARLGPNRQFYVILFNDECWPMLDQRPGDAEMLPATEDHIALVDEWLEQATFGDETHPLASVRLALQLQPDAMYLLSDGVFTGDRTGFYLRRHNKISDAGQLKIPGSIVHTVGLHNVDGQKVLKRIARENKGQFQFIPAAHIVARQ